MQNLNVGLIGGGFMGKAHSLAYAAMPMFLLACTGTAGPQGHCRSH